MPLPCVTFRCAATARVQTMVTVCRAIANVVDVIVRRAVAIVVDVAVRRAFDGQLTVHCFPPPHQRPLQRHPLLGGDGAAGTPLVPRALRDPLALMDRSPRCRTANTTQSKVSAIGTFLGETQENTLIILCSGWQWKHQR